MSHYFHVVPGRLRIKSPLMKRNNNVADVEGLLGTISGINSFDINTITGSILVNYNPKLVTSEKIINVFKEAGYFDPSKAITNDHYVHTAVSSISHTILSFATVLI